MPEAEMRELLLGMRRGEIPLEAAMEMAQRERAAAEKVAGYYDRPVEPDVLEDVRAAISIAPDDA